MLSRDSREAKACKIYSPINIFECEMFSSLFKWVISKH